jgi:hypothetical protein
MPKDCRHALHSFVRSIISTTEPEEEDVGTGRFLCVKHLCIMIAYYDTVVYYGTCVKHLCIMIPTVYNTWIRIAGMSNG